MRPAHHRRLPMIATRTEHRDQRFVRLAAYRAIGLHGAPGSATAGPEYGLAPTFLPRLDELTRV